MQHKKHYIRVVSQVAERLNTKDLMKLGNIEKIPKMLGDRA